MSVPMTISESEVLRADNQSIDVQKILFKLWENNRNAAMLNQLSEILCKFIDEKKVFTEIEFYLPQIAHLVIHMEQNVHSPGLETLAMVICQTSMHCALQFSFMLIAAMEDYQPEIAKNKKNPTANAFYFARCARLLQDVERAVIYGSPNLTRADERIFKARATTGAETSDLRTFKRAELAHQLSVEMPHSVDSVLNGLLYFKRVERKSMLHSKTWHQRYFVVDQRVLLEISGAPVLSTTTTSADTPSTHAGAPNANDEVQTATEALQNQLLNEAHMTAEQRRRFRYFQQMRVFVTNLTNICERLRFKEKDVRKYFLKRDMAELTIPPFAYLPLCNSVDGYYSIRKALPKECHAFTTKARVPALMLFEIEQHPRRLDVATFLNAELELHPDSSIFQGSEKLHADYSGTHGDHEHGAAGGVGGDEAKTKSDGDSDEPITALPSAFGDHLVSFDGDLISSSEDSMAGVTTSGKRCYWSAEGTGIELFVIQLMTYYQRAFAEANVAVWMHTYKIVSTSKSTGLIELIPNATSLDGLKKSEGYPGKLRLWYEQKFGRGSSQTDEFKAAIENYIASQAAYSIVTYLLAIKDRHNGNIMIDKDGHIVHIDFGFVFGLAPGKQFSMEKAPWKLNAEFVEVMGGYQSPLFKDYRQRCIQAFNVARRHAKAVLTLMEIMQAHSNYPAFRYNPNAIRDFRARLFLDRPDSDLPSIIDQLIAKSYKHTGTDLYDQFQLATNGIAV
eukprot:gene3043-2228_t